MALRKTKVSNDITTNYCRKHKQKYSMFGRCAKCDRKNLKVKNKRRK